MGEPSGAGTAPLRSSVVSLTNGPSIMILGRLGVFPTQTMAPDPIHFIRETRIFVHAYRRVCDRLPHPDSRSSVARGPSTRDRSLPGTSRRSVSRSPHPGPLRGGMKRGTAQGNWVLSWRDAESPLPGQVYVTAQVA